jgi:hypothetical protein
MFNCLVSQAQRRSTKHTVDAGNSAARFAVKHFPRFEFFLLPNRIHARTAPLTEIVGHLLFKKQGIDLCKYKK